jgi:AcrR family transcriptional regulator
MNMSTDEIQNPLEADSTETALLYRRPSQARGVEKFEMILDTVDHLLSTRGIDSFSLYDVAEEAGVASGSVYHFFPSMEAAFVALVERYDVLFAEICSRPIAADQVSTWEDILTIHFEASRLFINDHHTALVLIIGPGRTWASRQADTIGDTNIAQAMVASYGEHFKLPGQPRPEVILTYAIRILEALWELSFQQHGYVNEEIATETKRAAIAYLGLYWPRYLPSAAQAAIE